MSNIFLLRYIFLFIFPDTHNNLYGVISLPAGVFQPYSGVKTSILLMDKSIAKKTDKILFVKIENDGFSLGAQRKELPTSDLPDAINIITGYQLNVRNNEDFDENLLPENCLLVDKSKIAENGEYNLSGDRYKEINHKHNGKFELVSLSELCELIRGVTYSKEDEVEEDGHKVLRANNIKLYSGNIDFNDIKLISKNLKFSDKQKLKAKDIFICTASGSAEHIGKTAFVEQEIDYYFGGFMGAIRCNEQVLPEFLFQNLRGERFNNHLNSIIAGANIKNLKAEYLYSFKIPLPPLSVQQEIVSKIEQYEKIIAGARQVVENYKPQIDINPEWEMVELGSVCEFKYGKALKEENRITGEFPVFGSNGIVGYHNIYLVEAPFIIVGRKGSAGSVHYSNKNGFPIDTTFFVKLKNEKVIKQIFLYYLLLQLNLKNVNVQAGVPGLNRNDAYKLKIPLPPLPVQESIVSQIEKERELVNANKELIEIYEQKIKDEINKLWEE